MRKKSIAVVDGNKTDPMNTICDLKWNYPIFNFARGEFRSCCRTPSKLVDEQMLDSLGTDAFLNNEQMLQSRLDLINGVRHEDCRSCWVLEDAGMSSPRHDPDKFFYQLQKTNPDLYSQEYSEETLRVEMSKITSLSDPVLQSRYPYMLEVSLGNTCDMKCMYCSHHYSTQWAAERIKYKEITQEQYDREFPKATDKFEEYYWKWFDDVKLHLGRVGAIGGEPLIMPDFYRFVEKTIAAIEPIAHHRKNKMTFWIVTNLNTPPNYMNKFLEYLPRLSENFNVEILVSMEAIGKRAEYIRNGLDWQRFTTNLDKILSSNCKFDFGVISSINALSIASTLEFIQFLENLYHQYKRPVAIKQAVVNFPSHQSPLVLTPDFCEFLDKTIAYMEQKVDVMPYVPDFFGRWDQYIIFLKNLSESIRNNTQDRTQDKIIFANWFDEFDQRRNLNLLDTFPEYKDFYEMCKKL